MRWLRKLSRWAKGIFRRLGEEHQRHPSQKGQASDTPVAYSFNSASRKPERDSDRLSKDESSHQNRSLWGCAYEDLRVNDPKLVAKYENLLEQKAQAIGLPLTEGAPNHNTLQEGEAHNSRKEFSPTDLKYMLDKGLDRMEERKKKITMGSHEIVIEEEVAKAANFALWVKDLVGKAVEASPQASLAWAGVCLVLPLLTNPQTAKEAQRDGFDYATERMHFYTALEPIIWQYGKDPGENHALAKIKTSMGKVYQHILDFQIRTVLRFYQKSFDQYWQDVISSTNWTDMKKRIQDLATTVDGELSLIHDLVASSELKLLHQTSQKSFESLQKLSFISQRQLEAMHDLVSLQKEAKNRALSQKEENVRHLFRLSSGSQNATYEWYKSRVEDSIQGTCQWFLSQAGFTQWLAQESGTLLVTADPGCGKSVLSKHLIDHVLPPATAYFFFKDQDQNTVRQALCALLHQLFVQKPFLINHAIDEHSNSGDNMIHDTISLWRIFDNVVRDRQSGSVTIVLDALDECDEPELEELITRLKQHFKAQPPNEPQRDCKLKVFLTSRPYETIVSRSYDLLDDFPGVHIPGEQSSEAIGKEVNLVIEKRVEQLKLSRKLQEPEKQTLKKRLTDKLCGIPNRTYLWVHLVFEQLKKDGLGHETEKGVDSFLDKPPKNLPETYTRILQKCTNPKKTRMAFAIILGARRPLEISEFNVAMNVRSDQQGFEDLDLEPDEVFASKLPSLCGLLVSIHHGKVYFLHQTAREFLLENSSIIKTRPDYSWHYSISLRYAHTVLAEQCVFYLNLWNAEDPRDDSDDKVSWEAYAFKFWTYHLKEANLDQNAPVIPTVIKICQPDSKSFYVLQDKRHIYIIIDRRYRLLSRLVICLASFYGLRAVVEKLWTTGQVDIDSRDDLRRTPLSYAVDSGETAMVQWLLETGKVDVNSEDAEGCTPLLITAFRGYFDVFKLLMDTGKVNVNSKDRDGNTPLILAVKGDSQAIVELLMDTREVDVNSKDCDGHTALTRAILMEKEAIVKLLIDNGETDINLKDDSGDTPLILAAKFGNEAIVKLLLGTKQADINIKDKSGLTALDLAEQSSHHHDVAKLLRNYIA